MRSLRRIALAAFTLLVAGTGPSAIAAASPMAKLAQAYAKQNKLPIRTVQIDLPGRKVTRTFVPVTAENQAAFVDHFGAANGGLILRHGSDLEHPVILFGSQKGVRYAPYYNAVQEGADRIHPDVIKDSTVFGFDSVQPVGRFITMALDAPKLAHVEEHWKTTQRPADAKSGCMWWLAHAEVGKGVSLAHALGVKRSAATSNLIKKLAHAGNERVGVIGVAVPNLEAFNQLTDQQLLGAPPGGGAMEAMKE